MLFVKRIFSTCFTTASFATLHATGKRYVYAERSRWKLTLLERARLVRLSTVSYQRQQFKTD